MPDPTFRVVVTDQVFPSVETERAILAEIGATLEVAEGTPEQVREQIQGADALLNTYLSFDAEDIARLDRCRVIARYGIGVDNIALEAARERGIAVTNVPDYCVEEVAVHTVAMLLALVRRLPEGQRVLDRGGWGIAELRPVRRLSEMTVGIVGLGRIGRTTAGMLRAMGASVIGHDPYVASDDEIESVGFEELLDRSDAVSLHSPLTENTRGMIGHEQLKRMRSHAVLVNTSRGPLVVLDDLVHALEQGWIRGAGLDVFESEPLEAGRLEGVPGLLTTPHAAFYSESALLESQTKAATQVVRVLTGQEPRYRVNP